MNSAAKMLMAGFSGRNDIISFTHTATIGATSTLSHNGVSIGTAPAAGVNRFVVACYGWRGGSSGTRTINIGSQGAGSVIDDYHSGDASVCINYAKINTGTTTTIDVVGSGIAGNGAIAVYVVHIREDDLIVTGQSLATPSSSGNFSTPFSIGAFDGGYAVGITSMRGITGSGVTGSWTSDFNIKIFNSIFGQDSYSRAASGAISSDGLWTDGFTISSTGGIQSGSAVCAMVLR